MPSKYVGIDWGNEEHAVCVVDEKGAVKRRLTVSHTAEGMGELLGALRKLKQRSTVSIALERPDGVLVDTLVNAGHRVVPIHPNAVKATRGRYSAAGGKDDRGDAYILADVLRTDGHRFVELRGSSDRTRALKALSRTRDDLVGTRTELTHQIRAALESFWPGPVAMFPDLDALIALKFLDQFPTPASAARLDERAFARFLKENSYTGKRSAAEFMRLLRAAPIGSCGQLECLAKGEVVRAYVAALRSVVEQCTKLTAQIEDAMEQHPDAKVLQSFPRIGTVNAAQVLVELGDERSRFQSADHLAAEAGVVPVTEASGKRSHGTRKGSRPPGVYFRRACNKRLRKAITCFADNSRHASSWAAEIYAKAKARGCNHNHAVRVLARAWLRVLWRCWREGKAYDPGRHQAAVRAA